MGQLEYCFSLTTGQEMHQILSFIVDARVLSRIANSLQKCGLASISPTNDKTKLCVFLTTFESVEVVQVDSQGPWERVLMYTTSDS